MARKSRSRRIQLDQYSSDDFYSEGPMSQAIVDAGETIGSAVVKRAGDKRANTASGDNDEDEDENPKPKKPKRKPSQNYQNAANSTRGGRVDAFFGRQNRNHSL